MIIILFLIAATAAFSPGTAPFKRLKHPPSSIRLHYAALDPMSKADSTKSGCPFLIQKYEFRTFDVPVLFGSGKYHPGIVFLKTPAFISSLMYTDTRPIILYDSHCPISSRLIPKILKYGNIRYAPLQSSVGDLLLRRMSDEVRNQVVEITVGKNSQEDETEYKSIVVCDANRTYVKSSGLLEIMRLLTSTSADGDSSTIMTAKHSKRFKLMQYLALLSYTVPNRLRDRVYDVIANRKRLFRSTTTIDELDDRFVNDSLLTDGKGTTHIFQSSNPPSRGSRIKIVYPASSSPSITYDEEFPNGLCLVGGVGTISTVDLPMRIVVRVQRESLGLKNEKEGIIAWVKPEEVALL